MIKIIYGKRFLIKPKVVYVLNFEINNIFVKLLVTIETQIRINYSVQVIYILHFTFYILHFKHKNMQILINII